MKDIVSVKKTWHYSHNYSLICKQARCAFYTKGMTPEERNAAYQKWKQLRDELKEARWYTIEPIDHREKQAARADKQ